jgi:hypothetical protein
MNHLNEPFFMHSKTRAMIFWFTRSGISDAAGQRAFNTFFCRFLTLFPFSVRRRVTWAITNPRAGLKRAKPEEIREHYKKVY